MLKDMNEDTFKSAKDVHAYLTKVAKAAGLENEITSGWAQALFDPEDPEKFANVLMTACRKIGMKVATRDQVWSAPGGDETGGGDHRDMPYDVGGRRESAYFVSADGHVGVEVSWSDGPHATGAGLDIVSLKGSAMESTLKDMNTVLLETENLSADEIEVLTKKMPEWLVGLSVQVDAGKVRLKGATPRVRTPNLTPAGLVQWKVYDLLGPGVVYDKGAVYRTSHEAWKEHVRTAYGSEAARKVGLDESSLREIGLILLETENRLLRMVVEQPTLAEADESQTSKLFTVLRAAKFNVIDDGGDPVVLSDEIGSDEKEADRYVNGRQGRAALKLFGQRLGRAGFVVVDNEDADPNVVYVTHEKIEGRGGKPYEWDVRVAAWPPEEDGDQYMIGFSFA